MASFELEVVLRRKLDDAEVTRRLLFTAPLKQVDDIKSRIQAEFNIPKCMQLLQHCGNALSDAEQVEKLYLRSGDSILVSYYCEMEIEDFKEITSWLKQMRNRHITDAVRLPSSSMRIRDVSEPYPRHDAVACLFAGWGTPRTEVNRKYFVQEEGIELVLRLYAALTDTDWHELNSGSLRDLLGCLAILWNFCETRDTRLFIDQRGGFDLMVKSLSRASVLRGNETSTFADRLIGCISK